MGEPPRKKRGSWGLGFAGGGEDRLSDLPDGVIGHILSFLPSKEAGRAAVLSRRWRHIFANVHAISFEEDGSCDDPEMYHDNYTFYSYSIERRSLNGAFLDDVSAALLCRRRCGGLAPDPWLRTFRVAFHCYQPWDRVMVDRWLFSALQQISKEELHLDLRFGTYVACDRDGEPCYSRADEGGSDSNDNEDDGRWRYRLPRRIFSIAVLRSLRVSYCKLNPPEAIVLPCVETLHLTGVCDSWRTIRRLISRCPRLADLTLEDCDKAKRVSIPDSTRLHRIALRSCHNAVSVSLDASELTTLDYKGPVLTESFLNLHGAPRISSSTIGLCSASTTGFLKFLDNFKDVKHLHLQFGRLMSCLVQREGLPTFTSMRKLELTGKIHSGCDILPVTQILEKTPNLEVLSLFLVPDFLISRYGWERDYHMEYNDQDITPDVVPQDISIPCMRCRVREINLVHYQGTDAQRTLTKLLLNKAQVLEELCIVFPTRPLAVQAAMVSDINAWAVNKTAKMVFSEEK